jgi:uracil-DNA glycosylase
MLHTRPARYSQPRVGGELPASWETVVGDQLDQPYFHNLQSFVREERTNYTVYPPRDEVFAALKITPSERVRVFLLGQDPYHDANQAHGLAFSVRPGIRPPPSLMNIFKELKNDLGCRIPNSGYLVPWAEQGVLLLNAVLTVRAHEPNSHKGKGWEKFTDAVLRAVNDKDDPVVFLLWGGYARKKVGLIDTDRHTVIESAHPSPLSANSGFFGSRPFSAVNKALRVAGRAEIDWQIPDI